MSCSSMIAIVAATLLGSFAVGQPPPSIELRWSAGVAPASLQRRRLGARSLSYSYMCEAGGPCATPEALAHDYFDGNVTLIATYYQVSVNATSGERTQRMVNSTSLDTSKPTQYLIKFNAQDKAGNPADEVVVSMTVQDSTIQAPKLWTSSTATSLCAPTLVRACYYYTGKHYICSTNDKGGPGVYH